MTALAAQAFGGGGGWHEHLPLAWWVVGRFVRRLEPRLRFQLWDDLRQEAVVALARTWESHDRALGTFSTYAVKSIDFHLRSYMNRVERDFFSPHLKAVRARRPERESLERALDTRGFSANPVLWGWKQVRDHGDSRTGLREDHLHDSGPSGEDYALDVDLSSQTRKVLATLTPREEKVLRMRFGIGEKREHTLEEVGQGPDFGVTRNRIMQIEAKALRKLRHPSRSKRLRAYAPESSSARSLKVHCICGYDFWTDYYDTDIGKVPVCVHCDCLSPAVCKQLMIAAAIIDARQAHEDAKKRKQAEQKQRQLDKLNREVREVELARQAIEQRHRDGERRRQELLAAQPDRYVMLAAQPDPVRVSKPQTYLSQAELKKGIRSMRVKLEMTPSERDARALQASLAWHIRALVAAVPTSDPLLQDLKSDFCLLCGLPNPCTQHRVKLSPAMRRLSSHERLLKEMFPRAGDFSE